MTREEKIYAVLALLGPMLFEGQPEDTEAKSFPIIFRSATEIERAELPGGMSAINVPLNDNTLRNVLSEIIRYYLTEERKEWECCVLEEHDEDENSYEDTDGKIQYDPELLPNHPYHSFRYCAELIGEDLE